MKVIKIRKTFRGGLTEHFLVLYNPPKDRAVLTAVADNKANEWCEDEASGKQYGYRVEWEFVNDPCIIENVLKKELQEVKHDIEQLYNRLGMIEGILNL